MSSIYRRPHDFVRRRALLTTALLLGGAVPLVASGTGDATGAATLSVAAALTASGTGDATGSAALSVAQALVASGGGDATGTATITIAGQVDLVATGTGDATGTAVASAARSLEAGNTGDSTGSASLDVVQVPSTNGPELRRIAAKQLAPRLAAYQPYQPTIELGQRRVTILLDTTDLFAQGLGDATGTATLSVTRGFIATAIGDSTGTANLALVVGFVGGGTGVATGTASLQTSLAYVATGTGDSTGTAALSVIVTLTANGTGNSTGTAALDVNASGSIPLSAIGTGDATGSAALGVQRDLVAIGTGDATGAADLWRFVGFVGGDSGVATGAAAMQLLVALRAAGGGNSSGAADLNVPGDLNAYRVELKVLGPRYRPHWTRPRELAMGNDLLIKVAFMDQLTGQPVTAGGWAPRAWVSATPGGPQLGSLFVSLVFNPAAQAWTGIIDRDVLEVDFPAYVGQTLYVVVDEPAHTRWSRPLVVRDDGELLNQRLVTSWSPDPDALYGHNELLWMFKVRDEQTRQLLTSGLTLQTRLAATSGGPDVGATQMPATFDPGTGCWIATLSRAALDAGVGTLPAVYAEVDDSANVRRGHALTVMLEGEA